jgi:hypothetical protein
MRGMRRLAVGLTAGVLPALGVVSASASPALIGVGKMPPAAQGGGLAVTSTGAIVVTYARHARTTNYGLAFRVSEDDGRSWSDEQVVAEGCFRAGTHTDRKLGSDPIDETSSGQTPFSSPGGMDFSADLAVDTADRLIFVYTDRKPGSPTVYYGPGQGSEVRLRVFRPIKEGGWMAGDEATVPRTANWPVTVVSALVAPDGRLWVAWSDGREVRTRWTRDLGATWSEEVSCFGPDRNMGSDPSEKPPRELTPFPGPLYITPSLFADETGPVCLIGRGDGLWTARWDAKSGAWSAPAMGMGTLPSRSPSPGPALALPDLIQMRYRRPQTINALTFCAYRFRARDLDPAETDRVMFRPGDGRWTETDRTPDRVVGFTTEGRNAWRVDVSPRDTGLLVRVYRWNGVWDPAAQFEPEHEALRRPGDPQVYYDEGFYVAPRSSPARVVLFFRVMEKLYCETFNLAAAAQRTWVPVSLAPPEDEAPPAPPTRPTTTAASRPRPMFAPSSTPTRRATLPESTLVAAGLLGAPSSRSLFTTRAGRYVVFYVAANWRLCARFSSDGAAWQEPVEIAERFVPGTGGPRFGVWQTSVDEFLLSYVRRLAVRGLPSLCFRRLRFAGDGTPTLSDEMVVSPPQYSGSACELGAICQDADGRIWVGWNQWDLYHAGALTVVSSADGGATWSAPNTLRIGTGDAGSGFLNLLPWNGRVTALGMGIDFVPAWWSRWDGVRWSKAEWLSAFGKGGGQVGWGEGTDCSWVVDDRGRLHVLSAYYASRISYNACEPGGAWTPFVELGRAGGFGRFGGLSLTTDGADLWAVWGDGRDLLLRRRRAAAAAWDPGILGLAVGGANVRNVHVPARVPSGGRMPVVFQADREIRFTRLEEPE